MCCIIIDILNAFGYYLDKHGPTIFSWLGPIPFMIVSDPQVAQDILTSPHCINKGIIYKAVDDGAGTGLFSLTGVCLGRDFERCLIDLMQIPVGAFTASC